MKWLIDGRLLSDKNNGIHRYTLELIHAYQQAFGINNVFVLVSPNLTAKPNNAIVCRYYPFNVWHVFLFYFYIKKLPFTHIHIPFYSNTLFKTNKKIVTTVHDLMYAIVPNYFSKSILINQLAKWYFNIIVHAALRNSKLIISVSKTTAADLKNWGFNAVVFPEGINNLSNQKKPVESLLNTHFFLYVGNQRPQKNLPWMIDVFLKSNTQKKLVICGNGVGGTLVKNPKIIYQGYVDDAELAWLYQQAAAFVYPSFYEGFGLPVLEALNNGCKVICSNGGALAEFNNGAVLQFNLGDENKLKYYFEHIDEMAFNKEKAAQLLQQYNWQSSMKNLIDFVKQNLRND
ncbi:MAG: glycosyltransferase family 4 protein [Bacteroidia bacterium]